MIVDHPQQRGRFNYKHRCFSSAGRQEASIHCVVQVVFFFLNKKKKKPKEQNKSVLVHMESVSPQHTDRKQQSAQHEEKATQFLQAKVYSTPSIFSSQSAIEHRMKHLRRDGRRVGVKMHSLIPKKPLCNVKAKR